MGALKPQSDGPSYNDTVISKLAVDGWAVTFWYNEEGLGRSVAPPSPLLAVPKVSAHPSTASVPTSYHSMWHYTCLCTQYNPLVRAKPKSPICLPAWYRPSCN